MISKKVADRSHFGLNIESLLYQGNRKVFHGVRTQYQTIADMFVLVVSPGFSLVQTMMTTTDRQTDNNTRTNPLVEASLRDGQLMKTP